MARCPKCGSSNVHADKKGFSVKQSIAGAVLFGGIGLLAGAVGSNKIRLTCLDCGYHFKPGENAQSTPAYATVSSQEVSSAETHYTPPVKVPPQHKVSPEQRVKIETLLKYRSVIKDSKVALLEDLKSEGKTHVMVPGGEIDALNKLQAANNGVKRIVAFRECE